MARTPATSLLIDNESDFAIVELYITQVDNPDYGLFGIDMCLNEATFVIRNNTCTVFEATGGIRDQAPRNRPSLSTAASEALAVAAQ